jgi:hypothetical protein
LEARWLVALDSLGIAYNYELDGLSLPSGYYLPDLFLPQVKMWAEIKPVEFTETEKRKCKELADATGYPTLLLVGPPDFKTYYAVHSADKEQNYGDLPPGGIRYECDYLLDIYWHGRKHYDREHRFFGDTYGEFNDPAMFSGEYRKAIHLSRAARFEECA